MSTFGGGFNRSPQHILRTSLLGFDIAGSCVAAHSVAAQWRTALPGNEPTDPCLSATRKKDGISTLTCTQARLNQQNHALNRHQGPNVGKSRWRSGRSSTSSRQGSAMDFDPYQCVGTF
jgi:hypothetical protein